MSGQNQVVDFLTDMQAEPLLARWSSAALRRIGDPRGERAMKLRKSLDIFRVAATDLLIARLRSGEWIPATGAGHGLPRELIVSLTSFPPRFGTLDLTLASLLNQSIAPDRIILWLARGDEAQLPQAVRDLPRVSIQTCDDLGSYKKLVPALEAYPGSFIATADDDVFYGEDWLRTMVSGVVPGEPLIVCRRAHRLTLSADARIAPYADWARKVRDAAARRPSVDLVPNGVGGVLYPPGVFDPIVLDRVLFTRLCPKGDDLWFYWTARRAGSRHRQCGGAFWQLHWPDTQDSGLWMINQEGGNDVMVKALEAEFGQPL